MSEPNMTPQGWWARHDPLINRTLKIINIIIGVGTIVSGVYYVASWMVPHLWLTSEQLDRLLSYIRGIAFVWFLLTWIVLLIESHYLKAHARRDSVPYSVAIGFAWSIILCPWHTEWALNVIGFCLLVARLADIHASKRRFQFMMVSEFLRQLSYRQDPMGVEGPQGAKERERIYKLLKIVEGNDAVVETLEAEERRNAAVQ